MKHVRAARPTSGKLGLNAWATLEQGESEEQLQRGVWPEGKRQAWESGDRDRPSLDAN